MKIFGFAGPAGCGKDTAAEYLIEHHGYERVSFAAPLYRALQAMGFGWPKSQEEKEAMIPWIGKSWRFLAQTLGTEWGRELVHPDIWAKMALHSLEPGGKYVFTDVRFENEAKQLRAMGGVVVHIAGRSHDMTEGTLGHASEKGLEVMPTDFVVMNNGTLEDFRNQIHDISYMHRGDTF